MKTKISKAISIKSDSGRCMVSRFRDSNGFSEIRIKNKDASITFNTDALEGDYENEVRELAEMMIEICNNSCMLP